MRSDRLVGGAVGVGASGCSSRAYPFAARGEPWRPVEPPSPAVLRWWSPGFVRAGRGYPSGVRIVRREADTRHDGFDALVAGLDYPMFVVTAAAGPERSGCLVGFVTQTSIVPPRVLVCLSRSNATTGIAARSPWLAVHVLRRGDVELARWFGEATTTDGVDKFLDVEWEPGPGGVPILGGVDVFVGRVIQRIESLGDHIGHLLAPEGLTSVDPDRAQVPQLGYGDLPPLTPGHAADPGADPEPDQLPGVARDASSLVSVEQSLRAAGFTGDFRSVANGRVECLSCGRDSDAAVCAVHQLRRLEGASDPDELVLVVAIECPHCRTPGTLALTYGPMATDEDLDVLARLPSEPRRPDTGSDAAR